MTMNVEKTIPSEDVSLAWLAGIVDGEGSIGIYKTNQNSRVINLSVVNTDQRILTRVEEIYKKYNIFYSRYQHNYSKSKGFTTKKPCFVLTVRRRDDFERIITFLEPLLIGDKKISAQKVLKYLKENPRTLKPVYYCKNCNKAFLGRKKQFCTLDCWHKFSIGNKNPNYRHGRYIACND